MSTFTRLLVSCLVAWIAIVSQSSDAFAQVKQEKSEVPLAPHKQFFPVEQIPLTERHILAYIAATEEVNGTTESVGEDIDKLSTQTIAKLDAVVMKHGLADYTEYKRVGADIGLVTSGFDDVTRKYVGREGLIKLRIARVKADKKMSDMDKREALTDLNDQLQFALPALQYRGNIALVAKYYDKFPYYGD